MDNRCPVCRADLGARKLSQAIVARMEIDCSRCKSRIRLNYHWTEVVAVSLGLGAFVVLAALAYWLQNQKLMIFAFGTAMAGALALPLLEWTYLRTWPRYAPILP